MVQSKVVVVATIGTRDLMFQTSNGDWQNIGDDRAQTSIVSEQAEVLSDLGLLEDEYLGKYRHLTHYLLTNEQYFDRIKPVILGKLFQDKSKEIEKVYLVVTNQVEKIQQRDKDTIYSGEIIKRCLQKAYPEIITEIVFLGEDGTNPADFEQMFLWWRTTWHQKIQVQPQQSIWMCLKGGVGQASEAGRISGLSIHGDLIQFFEFYPNSKNNCSGMSSEYAGPFFGANYLWDRTLQQALKLLDRYDYSGVQELLQPHFLQDTKGWSNSPNLVKAGLNWHQGEFKTFFQLAQGALIPIKKKQEEFWWWMAYEQAQLGVIHLQQENTIEAMLHSFRAIEGSLRPWAIDTFPNDVKSLPGRYLQIYKSINVTHPSLMKHFSGDKQTVDLKDQVLKDLLEAAIPETANSLDFKVFWTEARYKRNELSHRLGGLAKRDLFKAWGDDIKDQSCWESRILRCLNQITKQNFKSLSEASLFANIHPQIRKKIADYQPKY